jgi:hypothetical protein
MQSANPANQPTVLLRPTNSASADSQPSIALPVLPVVPAPSSDPGSSNQEVKLSVIESSSSVVPLSSPSALPVPDKDLNWQPTNAAPNPWLTPAKTRPATPPANQPVTPAPAPAKDQTTQPAPGKEQSQGTDSSKIIARGQMGDNNPDPVIVLVQRLCDGRATDVDVRWTGSRRLSVCFECRGTMDAQKLVKDISARPEFVPYRIDFCVLVK